MKKSSSKLLIFDIILIIILLLNSFILNILNNYTYMAIFIIAITILFKLLFGCEKDSHRYAKDIIMNMTIIYLSVFIVYYILGIFIGFVRTNTYYTFYGITTFIIPYIVIIIVKEYLRYQMLNKTEKSKLFLVLNVLFFILIDVAYIMNLKTLNTAYNVFVFIAINLLPIISNNIVATYIAKKVEYKPNIFWLLIANLYTVLLPIIPDTGLYIQALIRLLFPFTLLSNTYKFCKKREHNIPLSREKRYGLILLPAVAILTFVLAYYVSGIFRYYAIAIASGSMQPNIYKGDVVIVDQEFNVDKLKKGQIIAYKYEGIIVVHRLADIIKIDNKYYIYSKGDANESKDEYIIYEDMIMGVVDAKIPYIGLPTVWLSELW